MKFLNSPPQTTVSMERLVGDVQKKEISAQIANKDVVVLIGPTGSGKTTTIHYFAGHKLIKNENGEIVLEDQNEEKDFKISSMAMSQTSSLMALPEIKIENKTLTFIDVPGFGDTEGKFVDLANFIALRQTICASASMIPVLIFSYHTLKVPRGVAFRKLLEMVGLLCPVRELQKYLVVLMTHAPDDYSVTQLSEYLNELLRSESESNTDTVTSLLEHIIELMEDDPKRVQIFNPISMDKKFLKQFSICKPMKNPKNSFIRNLPSELQIELDKIILKEMEEIDQLLVNDLVKAKNGLENLYHLHNTIPISKAQELEETKKKIVGQLNKIKTEEISKLNVQIHRKNVSTEELEKLKDIRSNLLPCSTSPIL